MSANEVKDDERAWPIPKLAKAWQCSPRHIYDLIDEGSLETFSISRKTAKRKRGLRVSAAEKRRWEETRDRGKGEGDHG